jgi:hypothetical protein
MDGNMTQDDIVKAAREFFELSLDADSENRREAIDDLRFVHGDQWPEQIKSERERDGRVTLTINKLPQFCKQVINDIRQNRPQIKVRAVDDKSDLATAKVYGGLIKNIEAQSGADMAYDTAADFAVKCGRGFFRVSTEYADDSAFDQDIIIKPIRNPFTVYVDPNAVMPDYSDQRRCIVTERMPREKFEARWPDAQSEWEESDQGEQSEKWCDDDTVRVAEYWEVIEEPQLVCLMQNGETFELPKGQDYKKFAAKMAKAGNPCIKTRTVKKRSVVQHIVTGREVLETNQWAGKYIPILVVVGEETYIEGERKLKSLIRDAKDPQRMYNYWRSASTEQVALASKSPYIVSDDAITDYEAEWSNANTKNQAYLRYKSGTERPTREPAPEPSAGMLQEISSADQDLYSTTGIYPPSLGQKGPEESGRAILARKKEGDISVFNFSDNLTRAIRHCGRILVDLIPKIYDTPRVVRIMGVDGQTQLTRINQEYMDQATGKVVLHDLTTGKYDIEVDTGPSYTTQKQEAAESMLEAAKMNPMLMQVAGDLLIRSMDWPNADEIAKRIEAQMQQQQQGGQQAPEMQALQMQQQIEGMKAQNAAQLQQQKLQAEFALKQMSLQKEQEIEQMRLAFEAEKAGIEFRLDVARDNAKISLEREKHRDKLTIDQSISMMRGAATEAETSIDDGAEPMPNPMEQVFAMLAQVMAQNAQSQQQSNELIATALMELPKQIGAAMNQPKRIVYDNVGRVTGAETIQ